MIKILKYLIAITLLGIAIYSLIITPSQIKKDSEMNRQDFKPATQFIDSFNNKYGRLPFKTEFNSWQRVHSFIFDMTKKNICSDSINDNNSESLLYQYLRVKKDFVFPEKIEISNVDLCNNYALAKWDGNEFEYYLSWNKYFSNNYNWHDSILSAGFYILISIVLLIYNKIFKRKNN